MSIPMSLLALISERPMNAAALRKAFSHTTGDAWPLNKGQVSLTLQRLVRDDLASTSTRTSDGLTIYSITDQGRRALATWWETPVPRDTPERDELTIKLAIALTLPSTDVRKIVQIQRRETLRAMQEFTRLKRRTTTAQSREDLAWSLVLERLIFHAEAEIRSLDFIEQKILREHTRFAASAPSLSHPHSNTHDDAATHCAPTVTGR